MMNGGGEAESNNTSNNNNQQTERSNLKSDSGSSIDDEASTASTAINTAVVNQFRQKHLISRLDHRNDHHHQQQNDLEVDEDEEAKDELYDNLNSSSLTPSDENVNDLDFQMSSNARPFTLAANQDAHYLGTISSLLIMGL